MLGDTDAALRTCAEGLRSTPTTPSSGSARRWSTAIGASRPTPKSAGGGSWACSRPDEFRSLDQGIYGHLTRRNLAVLAEERGDPAEAGALWRAVLAECPGDREALAKLRKPERVTVR